jgi:hypothetical protein
MATSTNRVGELISSSTYNSIRGKVNRVLGIGDGAEQGYGVPLESIARGDNELITAADMEALYNDLVKARTHQKGSDNLDWSNPVGLNPPSTNELIGYFASSVSNLTSQASTTYNLKWVTTPPEDPNTAISLYNENITGVGLRLRVVHTGEIYGVTVTEAGQNYSVDDVITVPGAILGGSSPQNDLQITVVDTNALGGIVQIDTAGSGKPEQSSEFATEGANEGIQDYIDAADDIEQGFIDGLIGPGQTTVSVKSYSRRTTSWSNRIDHKIRVQWESPDARRYFFNTGGEIRFTANLTGGLADPNNIGTAAPPSVKDEIWQSMLQKMGTVRFTANRTYSDGTEGSDYGFGNYSGTDPVNWDNTASDNRIKIFSQSGVGIYSENEYYIQAWQANPSTLVFIIIFNDRDLGDPPNPGAPGSLPTGFDEPVTGEVESAVLTKTATGSLGVPEPTVKLVDSL